MCSGQFFPNDEDDEENQFKDILELLEKESPLVKNLIMFSDRILLRMTPQRMIYDALQCFSEADECMYNYLMAISVASSEVIKKYCYFKYKEAIDVRTVVSKYLPIIKARNSEQLINKLYKESKKEEYHLRDIDDF
ncbi:MAG: hypothetical protein QW622_03240 [Candidatus Pacearchaeota archaeon]